MNAIAEIDEQDKKVCKVCNKSLAKQNRSGYCQEHREFAQHRKTRKPYKYRNQMRIKKQDISFEIEKMPNFLDVAAKAFQVTPSELNRRIEDGQITEEEFWLKFNEQLKKNWDEQLKKDKK